jgi:Xylose isomerase-like TIM barrel
MKNIASRSCRFSLFELVFFSFFYCALSSKKTLFCLVGILVLIFCFDFGIHSSILVFFQLECRNLKIQLDVFHFQQIHPKYDVVKWARYHRKSIGHIQIAQSPRRTEPHEKGDIDYAKILPALGELFPDLYCGLEYKPSSSTEAGLAKGKAAGSVFDYTAS